MVEIVEPTIEWKPHVKQEQFLSLPDKVDEALYGGAAGGGKSELLLMLPVCRGWIKHPRFKGIIFRREIPELKRSLIQRSMEMGIYKALGARYNGQDHIWAFPSGATIRFSHLQNENTVYEHKSAEYNYAGFDELTSFTEFQYIYMGTRVRTSDPSLPSIMRGASNPGGVGHSWVRKRFVEPYRLGGKLLFDPKSKKLRTFIPAKLTDNPFLMKSDPNYINRLNDLPEAERKALMDGDWWAFAGQVFSEWRENRYPTEPENALHVITPFPIPFYWPKIIAIDWGYTHMTWVGWFAVSHEGRVYLYREHAAKKTMITNWGADIKRMSQFDGNIVRVVIDPSARQNRGTDKTVLDQVVESTGWGIDLADNDRIGGKMLMHEMLRWKDRPERFVPRQGYSQETAEYIMRVYGTDAMHEYEMMFQPQKPETNLPKLQVFSTCPEFIKVVPACVHDEKRPEDVAKFDGDDAYDGGRYGMKAVEAFMAEQARGEYVKETKLSGIMEQFKKDPDYNRLAQQMEQVNDEGEADPVSMFHSEGGVPFSRGGYFN